MNRMRLKFYYRKPLFDVNLEEYSELENLHFSLQFCHVSQFFFRKEFGQIYMNIQIYNSLDKERPNTLRFKIYYKKPSLCYNCCFANTTIYVIKRPSAT